MDQATDPAEDAAALRARRERVRAFSERVADAVEAIPTATSFLEAERAARTLIVADKVIIRCAPRRDLNLVKPARQRIRVMADALLDTIDGLDMPATFLDAERAGRCALAADRLLTQLYVAPKPRHQTDEDDDYEEDNEDYFAKLLRNVDNLTYSYAYECGYWPDGTPLTGGERLPPERFAAIDAAALTHFPRPNGKLSPEESLELMGRLIATLSTHRTNAATRHSAIATGRWPDGSRCMYTRAEDAPDFYSVSKRTGLLASGRALYDSPPDESPGPRCMPGWIVRVKPPD